MLEKKGLLTLPSNKCRSGLITLVFSNRLPE
jgi:hypothetical protein